MAEKLEPRQTATFEEVLMSNVYTQEALINLLERKGLISKAELIDEIRRLRNAAAQSPHKMTQSGGV